MEEMSSLKRQREEIIIPQQGVIVDEKEDLTKRQKSYKDIITLLEEEEDLPNEDLSSLILQEEISSPSSYSSSEPGPTRDPARAEPDPDNLSAPEPEGEEERESVMRHLLEASDDELGLPNNNNKGSVTDGLDELVGDGGGHVDGGDLFVGGEGIWEFEEYEAANYYSSLQQQIF